MIPGLEAMIQYKGQMWLAQLYFFIPVSLILVGIGFFKSKIIPVWQSSVLIIGSLLFFNPDIDIISLGASVIISVALIPIGLTYLQSSRKMAL